MLCPSCGSEAHGKDVVDTFICGNTQWGGSRFESVTGFRAIPVSCVVHAFTCQDKSCGLGFTDGSADVIRNAAMVAAVDSIISHRYCVNSGRTSIKECDCPECEEVKGIIREWGDEPEVGVAKLGG